MNFKVLKKELAGELFTDETMRRLYATDASAYRELPIAVAIPKNEADIIRLVNFARHNATSIIPRTAGTSLAGQVVGGGIVMDVSQNFGRILEVNPEKGWAWVEPGIIRDDLNHQLKEYGLFFAPETSTANRAMIGGMIGNNSCGANSVVYGSAREHLLEVKTILSDGSKAWFGPVDDNAFIARCNGQKTDCELQSSIYYQIKELLSDKENRKSIVENYPDPKIPRRNTGYALDILSKQAPFNEKGSPFNFSSLLAGSEGTLAVITAAKIKLTPLPPKPLRLICIHCDSIDESLRANLVALVYRPSASELMDHYILEATKRNIQYSQYCFFVEGSPKAILVVELIRDSEEEVEQATQELISTLKKQNLGFAHPVIKGEDVKRVWGLRKAGLGLLSNVPGDDKPVPVIEDTAVNVQELPEYIAEFNEILKKYGLYSVHYAHAGSGELHLRPIINLKTSEGVRLFRLIAEEIADLVKKYKGSLSGEHGDGRLRGEFIPRMLGEKNYELIKQVKQTWDPDNIFNPGKIVGTPPMDTFLRYKKDQVTHEIKTYFDFSETQGFIRAAEQCNGSGDCRKSELSGGTMCPSYMATRNEKDTTRARANILREMLSHSNENVGFDSPEIKEVMDLCLSCKGCKSECPSNVDIAKMKAEWQQHYYDLNGIPFRNRLIANFTKGMKLASVFSFGYKILFGNKLTGNLMKLIMGFHPKRSMPRVYSVSLYQWFKKKFKPSERDPKKSIYLFCDEFTNYNDTSIGKTAVLLLDRLGYQVQMMDHPESGRTYLSKGLLKKARDLAEKNVNVFSKVISDQNPLIGLEPSAILTFRDEYRELLYGEDRVKAEKLASNVFTIEEFLDKEFKKGNLTSEHFTQEECSILLHGHCHQKSLSSLTPTKRLLSLPRNYQVKLIPSGCCGMAGSFGYEKEHYDVSMKIGELVLFPKIRNMNANEIIAASGTSCRHQIKDGTGRVAKHPVEILYQALV